MVSKPVVAVVFVAEGGDVVLRNIFENRCNFDEEKFANTGRSGGGSFRWTCCGLALNNPSPCDHHGRDKQKCSCDFCVSGEPVPPRLREKTIHNYGLDLHYGPDPRSFNPMQAAVAEAMRKMMKMDE